MPGIPYMIGDSSVNYLPGKIRVNQAERVFRHRRAVLFRLSVL